VSMRCANPQCTSQFDYRQGQLLRAPRQEEMENGGEIKHFWLCGACATRYYLEYKQGKGVIMAPQPVGRIDRRSRHVAAA